MISAVGLFCCTISLVPRCMVMTSAGFFFSHPTSCLLLAMLIARKPEWPSLSLSYFATPRVSHGSEEGFPFWKHLSSEEWRSRGNPPPLSSSERIDETEEVHTLVSRQLLSVLPDPTQSTVAHSVPCSFSHSLARQHMISVMESPKGI